jgi:hypothetical protein
MFDKDMYITPYEFNGKRLCWNGFTAICIYTKKTQDYRVDLFEKVSDRILGVEFKHFLIDRCSRWFQQQFPVVKYVPSVMLFVNGHFKHWIDIQNEHQLLQDTLKGFEGFDGFT